ncbi:DUF1275 family protein [Hafnia alvei]|uniref:DUF1275 domain-containing protein n=1 Tax=Hafnia alvei TaxID=569 RepID=A0A1C6YYM6_HAFAL|nr:DUF1275 family protein [Hafnia alvei]KKI41308.1 hypothetical protein XK86_20640 [Hafnia alvei]NLS55233.1 DUF1275 domain-containing protein [Hafnia alvei]TBL87761.1 DUF1275 domain-containing protein [Hafnia alvei]SCM51855.1 Protein of unknown function (DUF1275) [Hafnia alvei]
MNKISIYKTVNHEIHYAMSFIGGSIEIISFKFLYKALIGYMTSNMVFGINSLAENSFDFSSIYHILIVVIWMIIGAGHQFVADRYTFKKSSPLYGYAIGLSTACFFLILFMQLGHYMYTNNLLHLTPNASVMPLVTIGLVFMYIQNYIIKSGGTSYPTTTSVVTTVYILMITHIIKACNKKNDISQRKQDLDEGRHYIMVIIHFFLGAFITVKLSQEFDFLGLYLAFFILLLITFRVWVKHSNLKKT